MRHLVRRSWSYIEILLWARTCRRSVFSEKGFPTVWNTLVLGSNVVIVIQVKVTDMKWFSTLVADCKCEETIRNLQTVNLALVREEGPISNKQGFCGFSEEARGDGRRGGGLREDLESEMSTCWIWGAVNGGLVRMGWQWGHQPHHERCNLRQLSLHLSFFS